MFSHRGLFLAVAISLASIVFADVLVQPGYQHQYDSSPRYLQYQSVPQYQIQSPVEQYRAEQLPNQESTRYLSGVQTLYPVESNQARSHLVSYPHRSPYHHYHYLPRPNHLHYARIGGHGYVRPSVYVGYPQPLIVHNRSKRSRRSDPTSTESSKSEIVAHDNDVATKSPLTDEHPTTIDSLLPEHEPTDTNDKRVENRQINDVYITSLPRLYTTQDYIIFGPQIKPNFKKFNSIDQIILRSSPYYYMTLNKLPAQILRNQTCCNDHDELISNKPYKRFEQQEDTDDSQSRDAHIVKAYKPIEIDDSEQQSLQEITNTNMIRTINPRQDKITLQIPSLQKSPKDHSVEMSNAAATTPVQPYITYVQNQYRSNEKLSGDNTDKIGASYFDRDGRLLSNYYSSYSDNYPNHYSNHNSNENNADIDPKNEDHEEKLKKKSLLPIMVRSGDIMSPTRVADYVLYTNISARSNLAPVIPEMQYSSNMQKEIENTVKKVQDIVHTASKLKEQSMDYAIIPTFPTYSNYPTSSNYPTYPIYTTYSNYPNYPTYSNFPTYTTNSNNPNYPTYAKYSI